MNLAQFKKDIERELELSILGNGETPILNRLQIHLDNLNQECNLSTMLNPQNIQHELYLSMVYQIVYPAKKIQKVKITVDGVEMSEEKNAKQTGQSLLKKLGVDIIKSHPKWGKFVFDSKEEFYKKYSNNVSLLELNGYYLSILHILYSKGKDTLDKLNNFIISINDHVGYEKIKMYDSSYYEL